MSRIITSKKLSQFPELVCGISTKFYGNLRITNEVNEVKTLRNREKFAKDLGFEIKNLVTAGLSHGSNVNVVSEEDQGEIIKNSDALITNKAGVILLITVADCLPIMFYNPKNKVVALAHGGWRSLSTGIIKAVLEKFKYFKSNFKGLIVYIGPGVGACHFEVKDNVAELFNQKFIQLREEKKYVDLRAFAKDQLLSLGMLEQNIEASPDCTFCQREKYFSFRRDRPEVLEAQAAVIGMKE